METEKKIELSDFQNYIGDVNLEYGGLFINLEDFRHGYANCLRIIDIDSGCGFTGAVMVERITAYFDDSEKVKQAFRSWGITSLMKIKTFHGKHMCLIDSVVLYGLYDLVSDMINGDHRWIIQCEFDEPKVFDGWKADVILKEDDDLFEYLLREGFLSEFE